MQPKSSWRLIATLLLLCGLTSASAFRAFLWLDGIPGESTESNHKDWIDVIGFSEGVAKSPGSLPRFFELSFTKEQDKSSPLLFLRTANGVKIRRATLELSEDFEVRQRFYQVILSNSVVRAASMDGNAGSGGKPRESVGLSYEWISWTYTEFDGAGRKIGDTTAFWDLLRNGGTGSFRLTGTKQGTSIVVSWDATLGKTYRLSGSSNITGPYTFVQSVTPTSNGVVRLNFPIGTGNLFYRAEIAP